ncbi:hypothetical protein K474DRAFT_1773094 [Panus rudis PR-1116 ss-1]|nr:hypothetical protein K474DRAFT_1773094 [Panus rudis PR-1116 ss-1]
MGSIVRSFFSRRLPRLTPSQARLYHLDATKTHELFSVTTRRWLYNEEQQRAARYLPFNVQALIDVATNAADAKSCITIEKIQDGIFNRVLSLRFDNGVEFIAKIPFPTAGPKHYCTANEVATLDYLRTEHGIPTPVVRAWCSRAESSPVGIEYILYEKIPGVQLALLDNDNLPLEDDPFVDVLMSLVAIESRLSSTGFSQIGSIYYKEDVPESLRNRPLYADWVVPKANSQRFCIGPTVDREFWRAGRASLDIDRGPWPDARSWMLSSAACARASIAHHLDELFKHEYSGLISDYERLVHHIAPENKHFILWHPDFYPRNILVSDSRPRLLNGIIDWQGAVVALDCLQVSIPPVYDCERHPLVVWPEAFEELPSLATEFETLDDERQREALVAVRRAERKKLHEITLREENPELAKEMYDARGAPAKQCYLRPAVAITRGLEEGLPFIRQSFLDCRTIWPFVKGKDVPFPLHISDMDAEQIKEEWQEMVRQAASRTRTLEEIGVDPSSDGSVDAEEYDAVKHAFNEAKARAMAEVSSPEERQHLTETWPWSKGQLSLTAELCH